MRRRTISKVKPRENPFPQHLKKKKGISPLQELFCVFYVRTGNATLAAKLAGYSPKTPSESGSMALKSKYVQERIKELRAEAAALTDKAVDKYVADKHERQSWLTSVMRGDITDYICTHKGVSHERPAKLADRIRCAELLARMNGELFDRMALDVRHNIERVERVIVDLDREKAQAISHGAIEHKKTDDSGPGTA